MDLEGKRDKPRNSLLFRLWNRADQAAKNQKTERDERYTTQDPLKELPAEEKLPTPVEQLEQADLKPTKSDNLEELDLDPVDAVVQLSVSTDRMSVTMIVKPPIGDGAILSVELIQNALQEKGIVFGLRDSIIGMAVSAKLYNKPLVVARGTQPTNGKDGELEDLFAREYVARPQAKDDGSVDFKNLNLIQSVKKGTPICRIIPPEKAVDGSDVFGKPLHGIDGKLPSVPKGVRTQLNEDETALVAACNGCLRFTNGAFCVEETLRIDGDVDNSVGNIDFCGDVEIMGSVREGFVVRSGRDIVIRGGVEGATITAKANITVIQGINGMDKGVLEAGGDIHCRFLESCNIKAGGDIYAESMMNLTAYAEGSIILDGMRGVMIGGTYTAQHEIHAKSVGALSNTATTVVLGSSPEVLQEHKRVVNKLRALEQEIEALEKDLNYLQMKQRAGRLHPQQEELLQQKSKRKMVALMEASRAKKEQDILLERINNTAECKLSCGRIYPRVKVVMRNEVLTIQAQESLRLFYWEDGKICRGSITSMH